MEKWRITNNVNCLVIDAVLNLIACPKALNISITHKLNLLVQKSSEQILDFCDIQYICSSTTGKESLDGIQIQMGKRSHKLIIDVDTTTTTTPKPEIKKKKYFVFWQLKYPHPKEE